MTLLAACGPESEEAGDFDAIGTQVSGLTQVASSQDPIPARPPGAQAIGQQLYLTPVAVNGSLVLVPTSVNPAEPRTSSQDPIPARTPPSTLGVTVEPSQVGPRTPVDPLR